MAELYLRKMNPTEYEAFEAKSKLHYADEKEKAEGHTKEQAAKIAEDSFKRLLPQGVNSPNQFVYAILEPATDRVLGALWFAVQGEGERKSIFIYDIEFLASERGKGLGKKVMLWLEKEAKQMGIGKIGLHVFGHNKIARSLYDSLGYQPTNIVMAKHL